MKIAIVAVGPVDPAVLADAARCIREHFGCVAEIRDPVSIPEGSFDARRNQFSSVAFMLALARRAPGGAGKLIGLTACDLFIPMLTFVFGQAQLHGRIALVSLARLRQEFYGVAPDPDLFLDRMKKEIGHELGHSFGLIHCPDRGCVMSLATSIQEVDRKTTAFCHSCSRLVSREVPESGFEIQGREA